VGQVVQLEEGRAHVRLVADLSNTRRAHLSSAAIVAGVGGIASFVGVTLGVMLPVALLPIGLGLLIGFAHARGRRRTMERTQVSLEQVLDRLEHGEIETQPRVEGPRQSAFVRIADEIRKTFGA
jgi:Flp pilus assembly protein TadB